MGYNSPKMARQARIKKARIQRALRNFKPGRTGVDCKHWRLGRCWISRQKCSESANSLRNTGELEYFEIFPLFSLTS